MALTQMQLIQSLGEAMSWFERELSWGVQPTALTHLCGRIGELYAALITNGQMAPEVNQRGYDVVSADGERISVKTTAMMGSAGHISFTDSSLGLVDRVIVLRMNTEEMQVETLLNEPIEMVLTMLSIPKDGKRILPLSRLVKRHVSEREIAAVTEAHYRGYTIRELESGTIEIELDGEKLSPVKPILRDIAAALTISLVNSKGNNFNTRQLGTHVIKSILTGQNRVLREVDFDSFK